MSAEHLLKAKAAQRRERETIEEGERRRRLAAHATAMHIQEVTLWLYGSILIPLFILLGVATGMERAMWSWGPIASAFTFLAPLVLPPAFVMHVVIDVILRRWHERKMFGIYGNDPSCLYARRPAHRRRELRKYWTAGSIIVPYLSIWALSGTLDRCFAALGGARMPLALGTVVAAYAFVRFIVLAHIIEPRDARLTSAEIEVENILQYPPPPA